jgi:hypothetical protein
MQLYIVHEVVNARGLRVGLLWYSRHVVPWRMTILHTLYQLSTFRTKDFRAHRASHAVWLDELCDMM